jgi:Uma2 family endonuclease
MADLWERLGRVPLDRILMTPSLGGAVENDVLARPGGDKRLCELIDGVLVEKPMGQYESRLAALIIHLLHNFLDVNDLGIIFAPDGPVRIRPGRIRLPDIAFVSWRHFPDRRVPQDAILNQMPDLAIEVLSKSNTPQEMDAKVHDYFSAGCVLVWLIDPPKRTARAYRAPDSFVVHDENRPLDGNPVLPGFTLSLQDLFARAGAPPEQPKTA